MAENSVSIEATGLVYRNPGPDPGGIVAMFPSLSLLENDGLLATFDLDRTKLPLDHHTIVARSMDTGESWVVEGPVLRERPPSTTHSIRTSLLSDGSLVGLGLFNHMAGASHGTLNRQTYGRVPGDIFLVRSSDGGRSWTGPEIIEPPLVGPSWEICHPVLELADGRWLVPAATWRGWNGESPSGEQTVAFISDDRGRTWPAFGRIFDGRVTGLTHWEKSVVQLRDGRVLAVAWVYDIASGKTHPTEYAISSDRGETFSAPMRTGFTAQTCKIIQLRDGRLLCIHRRHDRPGLWATLAELNGDRWANLGDTPLWQGAESGMSGTGRGADELSSLRFGYPSHKELPGGDVLVLFWCHEDGETNVRWFRLRVA